MAAVAIVAALKLRFARAVALGNSLGDIAADPAKRVVVRLLAGLLARLLVGRAGRMMTASRQARKRLTPRTHITHARRAPSSASCCPRTTKSGQAPPSVRGGRVAGSLCFSATTRESHNRLRLRLRLLAPARPKPILFEPHTGFAVKFAAIQFAWAMQRVLSTVHSAVRGGFLFARTCLSPIHRSIDRNWLHRAGFVFLLF